MNWEETLDLLEKGEIRDINTLKGVFYILSIK